MELITKHQSTWKLLLLCTAALCVIASGTAFCAPESYLGFVSSAMNSLEQGRTADCVRSLRQAMETNANDPLAHVTLGLALLCGSRADDAMSEFGLALTLDKNCAEAVYGKGLVHLSEKRLDFAATAFADAQSKNAKIDTRGELAYVKALKDGVYAYAENAGQDSLQFAMNAIWLMSQQRHREATANWESLLKDRAAPNFHERPGCAISFLRSAPVSISGSALANYSKIVPPKTKLPVLSGTISLKADLSRARSVKMVLFFVDGRLVGITNVSPFQYPWDTSEVANGTHTLKIEGSDADGMTVSEKSTQVIVRNANASASDKVTGEEADALWGRLWNMLRLRASSAAINYNLAICAVECGDKVSAGAALERVMAANPDYLDAGDRLAALYLPTGCPAKLYRVDTTKKVIAFTFDDGPKAHTAQLLDLLEKKHVKATFFVVGKQVVAEPAMFKRIVAAGHEVANHTYNHRDLEYLSTREIQQEISTNVALIRAITGRETRFMRPPGAHAGERLPSILKKYGMTNVFWTANCTKFEGTTPQKMQNYVLSSAKPGGIILMHNLEGVTLKALPAIIDALVSKGYRFVTISELTSGG